MHDPATLLRPMRQPPAGVLEPAFPTGLRAAAAWPARPPPWLAEGEGAVSWSGSFGGRDGAGPRMAGAKRGRRGPSELTAGGFAHADPPERGAPVGTLVVSRRRPREWRRPSARRSRTIAAGSGGTGPPPRRPRRRRGRATTSWTAIAPPARAPRRGRSASPSCRGERVLDARSTTSQLPEARAAGVPALADYCLIDEAEPNGGLRRIARAHRTPKGEDPLHNTHTPRGRRRGPGAAPGAARDPYRGCR